jgi:RNA-directed DNA polymerase
MYEWKDIPWRKLERMVFKLQKRIFQASRRGDVKTIRRLERLLTNSWYAKLLAVRRVTQDNRGRKTAGIDGVKSLTPAERIKLAEELKIRSKALPTRRIHIPKPGTNEKRPLGIPTMQDRALQTLTKMALEPEWESRFEPNSYGFRPGRSPHDAVEAIFGSLRLKSKYVLDADISKCFDNIDHKKLLEKVNASPTINRQIKAWLKAGFMDGKELFPTDKGTPQGGAISPLLANIALHGLEERLKEFAETVPYENSKVGKRDKRSYLQVIRYADDFIVLHERLDVVKKAKEITEEWLKEIGLELKPSKTRIVHSLNSFNGKPGFDFLGFNFRHFKAGKNHSAKNTNKEILGHKLLIRPSEEKIRLHYEELARIITEGIALPQHALIGQLNRVIRGWAMYYRTVCTGRIYSVLDHLVFLKLWSWARKRHPRKNAKWRRHKYWHNYRNSKWRFLYNGSQQIRLYKHSDTHITRHTKVKGEKSYYDGDFTYWGSRMGKHPMLTPLRAGILKRQNGKCASCGLVFKSEDVLELDHITAKVLGGKYKRDNLQLLHRHCHHVKTKQDMDYLYSEDWYV